MRYDKENRRLSRLREEAAAATQQLQTAQGQLKKIREALDSTLHEVRRFSAEVSTYSEELSKSLSALPVDEKIKEVAETVFFLSGMISSRLAFTDLELNPKAVIGQQTVYSGVYRKFDKARHILQRRALSKALSIRLQGQSHIELRTLPAWELVPFVLLENAIKYSPRNQDVAIQFNERWPTLTVCISNLGPLLDPDELEGLFDRAVRGRNARRLSVGGDGLGLYLAKFLCDYHDIQISARSEQNVRFSLDNVPYSQFSILLEMSV